MIRLSLLFTALFSFLILPSSTAQVSLGYLDFAAIMDNHEGFQDVQGKLLHRQNQYAKELEPKDVELQQKIEAYQAISKANPQDARLEGLAQEAIELESQLKKSLEHYEALLEEERNELTEPILQEIEAVFKAIAKEKELDCIMQQTNTAGVSLILYAPPMTEMTVEAFSKLNIPLSERQKSIPPFKLDPKTVSIGYTNIENVLASWHKMQNVNQYLQQEEEKCLQAYETRRGAVDSKIKAYRKAEADGMSAEELKKLQNEIAALENNNQAAAKKCAKLLQTQQTQMMEDLLAELQTIIDQVAEENGFTYIINQTQSTGMTTLVYGSGNADITQVLMRKLGRTVPKTNELTAKKGARLAYVNSELVLGQMPEYKTTMAKLEKDQASVFATAEQKFMMLEKKKTQATEYYYKPGLTESERNSFLKEIEELDDAMMQLETKMETELMELQLLAVSPLLEKIQTAIDAEAKAGGYDFVLNQNSDSNLLYFNPEDDLTEKVFKRL